MIIQIRAPVMFECGLARESGAALTDQQNDPRGGNACDSIGRQ